MNLQHVIKLADILFPITRTNKDGSLMLDAGGFPARFIPGQNKIVTTGRNGRIVSIQLSKVR